jgi:hypothetical protein
MCIHHNCNSYLTQNNSQRSIQTKDELSVILKFLKITNIPTCGRLSIVPTTMILLQILTIMCILCDFSSTIKILKIEYGIVTKIHKYFGKELSNVKLKYDTLWT